MPRHHGSHRISRGSLLRGVGATLALVPAASVLASCAGQGVVVTDDTDGGATEAASTSADSGGCTETPEGEIGPYFADDSASGVERSAFVTNIDGSSAQTASHSLTMLAGSNTAGCSTSITIGLPVG